MARFVSLPSCWGHTQDCRCELQGQHPSLTLSNPAPRNASVHSSHTSVLHCFQETVWILSEAQSPIKPQPQPRSCASKRTVFFHHIFWDTPRTCAGCSQPIAPSSLLTRDPCSGSKTLLSYATCQAASHALLGVSSPTGRSHSLTTAMANCERVSS